MNDNVATENQTEAQDQDALNAAVAAAESAVASVEAEIVAAKDEVKAKTAANKDARANVKSAKAYLKSVGERTEENADDFDAGVTSLQGWEAALEQGVKDLNELREKVKSLGATLKTAKADLRAAKKAANPKSSGGSTGTRSSIKDEDVYVAKSFAEGEKVPGGMHGIIIQAFAEAKTVAEGKAVVKAAVEAKGEEIKAAQRWENIDAFIGGYLKGSARRSYITKVEAA